MTRSGGYLGGPGRRRRGRDPHLPATPGRTRFSKRQPRAGSTRSRRSPRSISRSSADRTDRAPAGCSRGSIGTSSSSGCARRPRHRSEVRHERRAAAAPRGCRTRSARAPSTRARTRRSSTRRSPPTPPPRRSWARPTRSRPSATPPRSRSATAIKGGATPDGPEVAELSRRRSRSASGSRRSTRSWPTSRPARGPAAAHPEPRRPRCPGRRRGGERHGPDVGRAAPASSRATARSARTRRRRRDVARKPHWEIAEALDIIDLPRGAKIAGSGFPVYKGAGSRAPARADQLVPRRPHHRERHDRGLAAGRRQQRLRARHRPDPGQGRPDVRRHARRPLPGPDGRGPGHEPPPRRDPRGRRAADPLRGLHAVLPSRGRRRRARTPAGSFASTSSTRSRWSCSSGPSESEAALEWMTERAEILLQRLGLAYRVLLMSTGEMGFVQAKKYDLEVWAPGVERWLEVSSCSNFRDYQARRMAIRYRPEARREAGARPHAERIGPRARPRGRGAARDVPAGRRHCPGARGPPAVPRERYDRSRGLRPGKEDGHDRLVGDRDPVTVELATTCRPASGLGGSAAAARTGPGDRLRPARPATDRLHHRFDHRRPGVHGGDRHRRTRRIRRHEPVRPARDRHRPDDVQPSPRRGQFSGSSRSRSCSASSSGATSHTSGGRVARRSG